MFRVLLAGVSFLFISSIISADTITLTSGKKIEGTVKVFASGKYLVDTTDGEKTIETEAVKSIDFRKKPTTDIIKSATEVPNLEERVDKLEILLQKIVVLLEGITSTRQSSISTSETMPSQGRTCTRCMRSGKIDCMWCVRGYTRDREGRNIPCGHCSGVGTMICSKCNGSGIGE